MRSCYVKRGYPVTSNDDDSASFVLRVASELLGDEQSGRMPTPVMGAEDFSYVLQQTAGRDVVPRCVPAGRASRAAHACHSNRMMLDEDALRAGTAMYAAMAIEFLAHGTTDETTR